MSKVIKITSPEGILNEEQAVPVRLKDSVYRKRKELLTKRIQEKHLDFAVLYGDREHFANIEYFTRYDCRFEETLLIVRKDGKTWIVAGNEGMAYSYIIPYEAERLYYGNFSLQGQPRNNAASLSQMMESVGIRKGSRIGLAGFKYYETAVEEEEAYTFDVPYYIVRSLQKAAGEDQVTDFTREITGLPDGLRMTVRDANEIAFIEYQSVTAANCVRRMLKNAKAGMTEMEISRKAGADLRECMAYPNILAGERSVSLGLKSPDDFSVLEDGSPMTISYSARGSMCARSGMAATGYDRLGEEQKKEFDAFYENYWHAIASWYAAVTVGVTGKEIFEIVHRYVGDKKYGVALNPGHCIGMDEWSNSPVSGQSEMKLYSGLHFQCDIVACMTEPVMAAICEDTIVIADEHLREALRSEYPEVYDRVVRRQEFMRKKLGIPVHEDVLPMSGNNGVMFPFLLDRSEIFALEK